MISAINNFVATSTQWKS